MTEERGAVTITEQMEAWGSTFGREYTDRNPHDPAEMDALYERQFGVTRSALNREFLDGANAIPPVDRSARILEVGANVGAQLQCLQAMGFTNLYGIELQPYAVELSKQWSKGINLIQGSAFDVPFKDGFFDLVFTSGVLIHISPAEIGAALDEIHRCSRHYIWGFEYFAEQHTEIPYRGKGHLMWKSDFARLYTARFADTRLVQRRKVKYLGSENVDEMYLLAKK